MKDADLQELAKQLVAIAERVRFDANALTLARELPWTTNNDRDMLTRYLWGNERPEDKAKLHEFAVLTQNKGEMK